MARIRIFVTQIGTQPRVEMELYNKQAVDGKSRGASLAP